MSPTPSNGVGLMADLDGNSSFSSGSSGAGPTVTGCSGAGSDQMWDPQAQALVKCQ